jgi:fructuronate reductase
VRLSPETLSRLPASVDRFSYDRNAQSTGIVHFGIGAFHRAHQAWYTDLAMDGGDRDWGILGVSLRSPNVGRQLNPQSGIYTVSERGMAGDRVRVVGAVQGVLMARNEAEDLIAAIASPATRIVSFTITEKGYCRSPTGSLDFSLADECSIYRFLAAGFRQRRGLSLPGLTLLSCDNLADNGARLAALVGEYLHRVDRTLAVWFERECTCPATMIDRIVPATTDMDRDAVADALGGVRDEAAVITEPFSQWIIEDRFAGPRPAWEKVGATLVADVAPYEKAKLRMLNGAHSALAYLGLERGYRYVHEAVADPQLRSLVLALMRSEAAPTVDRAPGQDLEEYAVQLLQRFDNPALDHRLSQIAMDGSQKIPQRWLATLSDNRPIGRQCPAILRALGAWLRHVRGDSGFVDDPLAEQLAAAWRGNDLAGVAREVFGPAGPLPGVWDFEAKDLSLLA